ncbi:MAG: HAD family hydrolase, partial [Candidatus Hodarchaeota archaeon]
LPLDSLTVLNQLNKCNLPLALVTDGPTVMQTAKIEVLGIKRFIDHLYITDSLGSEYAKPSTLIFKRVLQDLSIEATKSVYVGDNPYKDFIGAKQVGLKTIRLIREKGLYSNVFLDPYHEAEITIQKIDAIHKYLNIRSFR